LHLILSLKIHHHSFGRDVSRLMPRPDRKTFSFMPPVEQWILSIDFKAGYAGLFGVTIWHDMRRMPSQKMLCS